MTIIDSNAKTPEQIIQVFREYQPTREDFQFPQAEVNNVSLLMLHQFLSKWKIPFWLVVHPSRDGITITTDPVLAGYAWTPTGGIGSPTPKGPPNSLPGLRRSDLPIRGDKKKEEIGGTCDNEEL